MPADKSVPWDLISMLRASSRKQKLLRRLDEDPACASEIAEETHLQRESISNQIRALKKTEPPLVECLTPHQPHHRIYGVTKDGEKVLERV